MLSPTISFLLGLFLSFCADYVQAAQGVGFQSMSVPDPMTGKPMQVAVFYPSDTISGQTQIGPVQVDGTRAIVPQAGRHPLIVFSHGSAGSALGHNALASRLARGGYIVAAINHPGDNFRDQSKIGTPDVFLGRPRQISALIDAMLSNVTFGPLVSTGRIGAAGFSMGGYTALVLGGARPDFGLITKYCRRPEALGFCARELALSKLGVGQGLVDKRVKAVIAMDPFGGFFDKSALSEVKVPVLLIAAGASRIVPPSVNAEHIRDSLPQAPEYVSIPGADHFVFLSPCSPEQAQIAPALCQDPKGVDRKAIHEKLINETIVFFSKHLR